MKRRKKERKSPFSEYKHKHKCNMCVQAHKEEKQLFCCSVVDRELYDTCIPYIPTTTLLTTVAANDGRLRTARYHCASLTYSGPTSTRAAPAEVSPFVELPLWMSSRSTSNVSKPGMCRPRYSFKTESARYCAPKKRPACIQQQHEKKMIVVLTHD